MRDSSRRREASGGLQFLEYSLPFLSYLSPNRLPSHLSPSHFTRSAIVLMPKSFQADERPYNASHSARRSGRGASQPEVTLPRFKDGNRISYISHTVSWGVSHTLCFITWVGGKKELKTADDFAFEGGDEDLPTSLGKRSAHKAFSKKNSNKSIEILLLWVVSLLV